METKPDGLTAKQREFARLVACGHSQAAAYRLAYDVRRAKPETVARNASKLMHNTYVATMVRELLKLARIEDIVSVGQHTLHILEDREAAKADGNYTALAAFDRTLAQVLGMTNSTVLVAAEKSETDQQLIAQLSGGDPVLEKHLRAIIGRDSFGNGDKDEEGEG